MEKISAALVKELREKTGAGMMDCKAALSDAGGDVEQAIEILRKQGLKDLDKRSSKIAAEGTIGVYIHGGNQIVSLVELNCETDFVARGEEFQKVAKDIAMHVAAMKPRFLSVEDIPAEVIKKEEEIAFEQLNENQRDKADKIIPGKMEKYFEDSCLLMQSYIKDDSGKLTVKDVIDELGIKVGEKVSLRRFLRYEVGEGVQKKETNLAEEVASMV